MPVSFVYQLKRIYQILKAHGTMMCCPYELFVKCNPLILLFGFWLSNIRVRGQ